jgi:hypothetical protein
MKYRDLLQQCVWQEIWDCLLLNYDDQRNLEDTYKKIYDDLIVVEGISTKRRIVVKKYPQWVDVSGKDGSLHKDNEEYATLCKDNEEYANSEIIYGIEFEKWGEWVEMEIDQQSLIDFTMTEIAAHCLWEMTFMSFNEDDISSTMNEMLETVQRIKDGTIELIPFDIDDEIQKLN